MVFLGDEKGAIQGVLGGWSDGGCDPLTFWNNVLTVWEAAGAKRELAAFILAQEASYKNWDGGTRNSTAANLPRSSGGNKSAAWSAWRSLEAILTKAKNRKCRNSICFFYIAIFWKSSGHTSYLDRLTFRTKVGRNKICKRGYLGQHYSMFI